MMSIRDRLKSLTEMGVVASDLARGRYPDFVYGRPCSRREIPIFTLHSIDAVGFERILQFLTRNGYRTLDCDEYCAALGGDGSAIQANEVLLTIDDGLGSVWAAAYPLLEKYRCKAVVFLISSKVPDAGRGPNLTDVWSGRAELETVLRRDQQGSFFSSWKEIGEMHASGWVDFQSHTHHHALVFSSDRIVDFVTPEALERFHPFEFSALASWSRPGDGWRRPELGTPLYAALPRMAARPGCKSDPEVARRCVEHVAEHGGPAFFERAGWRAELEAQVEEVRRRNGSAAALESDAEVRAALLSDLRTSRETLERALPGKSVRHLCYPWGVGSELGVELSRQAGFASNFWGRVDGRLRNAVGVDRYKLARIGEDFLWLLPGEGRSSLRDLLRAKLRRRVSQGSPYLSH